MTNPSRALTAVATVAGFVPAFAAVVALAQAPAAPPSPEAVKRAEALLAEARNALGGDKLSAVKTITATGRTRRIRGDNLVPIEFELMVELPDKYVRIDEFPAEDTEPTSSGFNGDALIQIPPPPTAPPGGPSAPPGVGRGGPGAAAPVGPGGAAAPPLPGGAPAPTGRGGAAAPPGPAGAAPATPSPTAPAPARPEGAAPSAAPGTSSAPSAPGGATAAAPPGAGAPAQGRGMPMPGGRGPAMDPRRARLATVKQDFARLALGLLAASPAYPLTFSFAAVAEAPQGRADVLDVKGEGTFALRYFINSETHLPVMVTWTTPPTNVIVTVPGQTPKTVAPGAVVVAGPPAPPAGAAKEETEKYAKEVMAIRAKAQSTPVEQRLYFADYREVEGLKLPFRLRRSIGTETTEETTFDRFRINSKIDSRKFQPVK
jgi:hypothetical protein